MMIKRKGLFTSAALLSLASGLYAAPDPSDNYSTDAEARNYFSVENAESDYKYSELTIEQLQNVFVKGLTLTGAAASTDANFVDYNEPADTVEVAAGNVATLLDNNDPAVAATDGGDLHSKVSSLSKLIDDSESGNIGNKLRTIGLIINEPPESGADPKKDIKTQLNNLMVDLGTEGYTLAARIPKARNRIGEGASVNAAINAVLLELDSRTQSDENSVISDAVEEVQNLIGTVETLTSTLGEDSSLVARMTTARDLLDNRVASEDIRAAIEAIQGRAAEPAGVIGTGRFAIANGTGTGTTDTTIADATDIWGKLTNAVAALDLRLDERIADYTSGQSTLTEVLVEICTLPDHPQI